MTNPLVQLGRLGQSPWYDFITRDLVRSGQLGRLIAEDGLLGMTSNPSIFEKAVASSSDYDEEIRQLAGEGLDPKAIFETIAIADVRAACDLFLPTYRATGGRDGLVSLEVSPALAHNTSATIAEAQRLWRSLDRPNAMIKIPGTLAGLPAVTECIAAGINVNVTLLFSTNRYRQVIEAYLEGLEARDSRGLPLTGIASVASFFVSRVDTRIDPMLDQSGDPHGLRGTIAIANAAVAYLAFQSSLATSRWATLAANGAAPQRPLWASTSTKDPRYPDVYYVEALIARDTVNTLPPETFTAYRDHGKPVVRIDQAIATAAERLDRLAGTGIDLAAITEFLEQDGVTKFAAAFDSLLAGIDAKASVLTR
jgi:transaldolase